MTTARHAGGLFAPSAAAIVRPSSRHGFGVVVAVVLVVVSASSVPSPLYGLYQQRWQITPVAAAVMYACYALGVMAALAGGRTVRGLSPRRLMLAALGTVAVSATIFACVRSVWALDVARVVQGVGTGLINATAAAALTALHPSGDTGRAASATSAATAGGIGLGAAASGALVQWAPAPLVTPYLVLLVAAVCGAASLLTVPAKVMQPVAVLPRTGQGRAEPLSTAARRALRIAGPLVAASWAVTGMYLALGVELTARLLGTGDRAVASLIIVVVQGSGGVVQVLCRRWSSADAGVVGCAVLVVGVAASVAAVGTGLPVLFFGAAAVVGSGFGLCFLAGLRIVSQDAGDAERSRAVGTFFLVAYLAVSVPAVAAGLAETRWGLDTTFVVFGALVILGCTVAGGLVFRHRRKVLRSVEGRTE